MDSTPAHKRVDNVLQYQTPVRKPATPSFQTPLNSFLNPTNRQLFTPLPKQPAGSCNYPAPYTSENSIQPTKKSHKKPSNSLSRTAELPPTLLFKNIENEHSAQQADNPVSFFTPQTKLAKPLRSAFHSTGLISKKNRPRQTNSVKKTPETPAKKLNFNTWTGQSNSTMALKTQKSRANLQESPIKSLKVQNESLSPLTMAKTSKGNSKASPLRYPRISKNEKIDSSPEDWVSRSRCVSTPESASKPFVPQYQASPIKRVKFNPSTNLFEGDLNAIQSTPLRKTQQFSWLSSHQIYTPYPRFIDASYLRQLREAQGPNKESFSDADIYPDYFQTQFYVLSKLGQGEFAEVFQVYDKDGMKYAIKKTKSPYTGHRDRMKKLEEVEIMLILAGSSRCVQLISSWEQFGYLYLQMELCEGGTLQDYLDEATRVLPIEEFQIWRILAEIALGLKEIHSRDIMHLDIKPANIFLDDGKLKLGDFGLATFCPVNNGSEREGDRTYIAPEILGSNYEKSADIFSLGLIILEICGNFVLPEYGEYWQMLRNDDFSEVKFGSISPPLIELVKSMLKSDPTQRPKVEEILTHPFVATLIPIENNSVCENMDLDSKA